MTKYFLAFILLASPCLAGMGIGGFPYPGPGVVIAGSGSGDVCTGTQLFAAHFENNDDVTAGTPSGCSVGDTTLTRVGVTYSTTQKSDGEYSSYATAENSSVSIDSLGMDVSIAGTWCGDIYYTATAPRRTFTISASGAYGQIVYSVGGNTARTVYGSESLTSTDMFVNDTLTRVCHSWDASAAGGADKLAVKVGTNGWLETTNRTLTSLESNPSIYYITSGPYQYYPGYIDNVKLYSDYKHAE